MADICQTAFSNAFSWKICLVFCYKFHWSLFLMVQLTVSQCCFRYWLSTKQVPSHFLTKMAGHNEWTWRHKETWPLVGDDIFQLIFVSENYCVSYEFQLHLFSVCSGQVVHVNLNYDLLDCDNYRGFVVKTHDGMCSQEVPNRKFQSWACKAKVWTYFTYLHEWIITTKPDKLIVMILICGSQISTFCCVKAC